jgi:hypothetical protein
MTKKVEHDNGCVKCGITEARKWHNARDGSGALCVSCYEKLYRFRTPEYKNYHSNYHKKKLREQPALVMFTKIKSYAKNNNIPFDLDLSDIVIPERCPILNIPLVIGEHGMTGNSPTLDKVVPSLGYVKGNVAVISARANRKKDDSSLEELEAIVAYIKRFSPE